MKINLKLLADFSVQERELIINIIATWNYNAWNKYDSAVTIERSKEHFAQRALNKDHLPLTIIAIDEDIVKLEDSVVGMITLKESIPVPGYDNKKPWLGSLVVLKNYQHQGVGTLLEQKATELANSMGFKEMFLFTSDPIMPAWYSDKKRGWEVLKKDTYPKGNVKEHPITVMKKNIQ